MNPLSKRNMDARSFEGSHFSRSLQSFVSSSPLNKMRKQLFGCSAAAMGLLLAAGCGRTEELSVSSTTSAPLTAACPATVRLAASRTYTGGASGTGTTEVGRRTFESAIDLEIPSSLPVVIGNAGNRLTELRYFTPGNPDPVVCRYRGGASQRNPTTPEDLALGEQYTFESCSNGTVAGATVRAKGLALRVRNGASSQPADAPQTTVAVSLNADLAKPSGAACPLICDTDSALCTGSAIYPDSIFVPTPFDGDPRAEWVEASINLAPAENLDFKAAAHAPDGTVLYKWEFSYDIRGAIAAGAAAGELTGDAIAALVANAALTDTTGAPLTDNDGLLRYTLIEGLQRLGVADAAAASPTIAGALQATASRRDCFGRLALAGSFAATASAACGAAAATVGLGPFGAFAAAVALGKCAFAFQGALARKSEALCCLGESQPNNDCTCAERTNGVFPDQKVETRIFPPGLFYSCECKQPESPCDTAVCTAEGKQIEPNGPASCPGCANRVCDTATNIWQCENNDPNLGGTCAERTCFRTNIVRDFRTIDRAPNDARCYQEGTTTGFVDFEVPPGGTYEVVTGEPSRNNTGDRRLFVNGRSRFRIGAEVSWSGYCCGCAACCIANLENRISYTIEEIPCDQP